MCVQVEITRAIVDRTLLYTQKGRPRRDIKTHYIYYLKNRIHMNEVHVCLQLCGY